MAPKVVKAMKAMKAMQAMKAKQTTGQVIDLDAARSTQAKAMNAMTANTSTAGVVAFGTDWPSKPPGQCFD